MAVVVVFMWWWNFREIKEFFLTSHVAICTRYTLWYGTLATLTSIFNAIVYMQDNYERRVNYGRRSNLSLLFNPLPEDMKTSQEFPHDNLYPGPVCNTGSLEYEGVYYTATFHTFTIPHLSAPAYSFQMRYLGPCSRRFRRWWQHGEHNLITHRASTSKQNPHEQWISLEAQNR